MNDTGAKTKLTDKTGAAITILIIHLACKSTLTCFGDVHLGRCVLKLSAEGASYYATRPSHGVHRASPFIEALFEAITETSGLHSSI
jgi:hypothetical protein